MGNSERKGHFLSAEILISHAVVIINIKTMTAVDRIKLKPCAEQKRRRPFIRFKYLPPSNEFMNTRSAKRQAFLKVRFLSVILKKWNSFRENKTAWCTRKSDLLCNIVRNSNVTNCTETLWKQLPPSNSKILQNSVTLQLDLCEGKKRTQRIWRFYRCWLELRRYKDC